MNPSTSSMNMYKVSEDGGPFRLPGLEKIARGEDILNNIPRGVLFEHERDI